MSYPRRSTDAEVDQLLLNAQLRDEIEPYVDESIECLDLELLPTEIENQYLGSMLAWERAPAVAIYRWFEPELRLPPPESLDERRLHDLLWDTIHKLFQKQIVLDFTDHLSDRELYTLIRRDVLPTREKKLDLPDHHLHFDCADACGNPDVWLRYYASDEERHAWSFDANRPPPQHVPPPYPRSLPRIPL